MKEKIFVDFVKETKSNFRGHPKAVEYSPFGQRTKFIVKIDVKNIVDQLKEEGVIPNYQLPEIGRASCRERV